MTREPYHDYSATDGAPRRNILLRLMHGDIVRWVCALVGFTTPFTVQLMGNFPLAEWILLAAAGIGLLLSVRYRRWPDGVFHTRWFLVVAACLLLGLMAYVFSDLYRGSASQDYLRGWARMVFLAIDFLGLAYLIGSDWRRWLAVKAGLIFGVLAEVCVNGPLYGEWWKFGFAGPITLLALILAARRGLLTSVLVAAGLGVLHLTLGFRNFGGICLVTASLLLIPRVPPSFRKAAIAFALVTAAVTITAVYLFLDETAGTTHDASNKERYAMVSVASDAFLASPLVGHGSWFSATHLVRKIEAKRMKIEDGFGGYSEQEAAAISIHSQLLVALAEGGFFGGLFFLVYGGLVIWALLYALQAERPQQALLIFTLIGAMWDLAMSPFSGPARVHIAAASVLALLLWLEHKGLIEWKYPPGESQLNERHETAQSSYS